MNLEQLLKARAEKMEQAQNLYNQGNLAEANAIMNEIEQLDKQIEEAKKFEANMKAMQGAKVPTLPSNEKETNSFQDTYREAFRNAIVNKDLNALKQFQNKDETTKITDASAFVMPQTLSSLIISKLSHFGNIYTRVTETNVPAGVAYPLETFTVTAEWKGEGAKSERKKVESSDKVTFNVNKLIAKLSITHELRVVSLEEFEDRLASKIAEALVIGLEESIINGSGTNQPKGITKLEVVNGQKVEVQNSATLTIQNLLDAEALLPLAYDKGAVWTMSKETFIYLKSLRDENGRFIGTFEMGKNGFREPILLDREVVLTDHLEKHNATISKDEVIAFLFNYKDYGVNFNEAMSVRQYIDEDTDEKITKGTMLVDGKPFHNFGYVPIIKKHS